METCDSCGKDYQPEEEGAKKTLLRRKLDFIADQTADLIMDLFDRNREVGKKPDDWSFIGNAEDYNAMLKHCPELDSLYAAALDRDVKELNQAAELMEANEFEEIRRTDPGLAGRLLNGPEDAFCFELNEECLKQAKELRLIREAL